MTDLRSNRRIANQIARTRDSKSLLSKNYDELKQNGLFESRTKIYDRISRNRLENTTRFHISINDFKAPHTMRMYLSNKVDSAGIILENLLNILEIPLGDSEAKKIFSYDRKINEYWGGFKQNGEQKLADLLGRELHFYWGYRDIHHPHAPAWLDEIYIPAMYKGKGIVNALQKQGARLVS